MSNKIYFLHVHQVNLVKSENLVSIYYLLNLLYAAIKNDGYIGLKIHEMDLKTMDKLFKLLDCFV